MSAMFNALDRNGDGVISRSEFSAAMAAPVTTISQPSTNVISGYVQQAPITTASYVQNAAPITTFTQAAVAAPRYNVVQPAASTVFNAIDANGDGKISRTEFANYVSGANYIRPAAPVATYVQPSNYVQPATSSYYVQPAQTTFNAIDTNGDGKISRTEFANYVSGANYVQPAPAVNYVRPNYVSGANYVTNAAPVSTYVQPAASTVFNAIDANGDGKISRTEFANYVSGANYIRPAAPVATYVQPSNYVQPATSSYYVQPAQATTFNAIDTNGDGKISRTEFANYVSGANYVTNAAPVATYVQPAAATYVQPAANTVFNTIEANYIKPAAPVATYVQPSNYVQPASSYIVQPAQSTFNAIDTNGDGKISRTEFANFVSGANYVQPAVNYVQQPAVNYVQQPAVNYVQQPSVNYVQQPAVNYVQPAVNYVQPATSVFNAIDTNGDGKISRSEFANFVGQPLQTTYAPIPATVY